jgi:hypothetical protein
MADAQRPGSEPQQDDSARLDDYVKRFDDAWQRGPRPALEDYLPAAGRDRRAVLVRLVHVDLERRLKAAEPARVEGYVERYPELAEDQRVVLDLVVHEYKVRRTRGAGLTIDEHIRRFPQYERLLKEQFGTQETAVARPAPSACPPTTPGPAAPEAGKPDYIGKYRVIERLGSGGQADVFRALHPLLPGRDVVIKWFRKSLSEQGQAHVLEEGRALAGLDDPGIVRIYDVDVCQCRPFMVLEHIAGCTLADQLRQGRPTPRTAAALAAELARTLARVHRQGVLHRDLKPANILIDAGGRPRLVDFGLAWTSRSWQQTDRLEGEVVGTFEYMAPEQANGETGRFGPATDVFGLAGLYKLFGQFSATICKSIT